VAEQDNISLIATKNTKKTDRMSKVLIAENNKGNEGISAPYWVNSQYLH